MIESIASLLLLVLPGYALLRLKWVRQKKDFSELDKVIFGFVLWVFYLVATLIIVKTTFPGYERYLLWFNYFTGLVIIAHWFFTDLRCRLFYISGFKLGSRLRQLKREPTLLFLVPCITFVVLITLYSPIIYQYDATAVYLIEGRQIADGAFSSVNNWPTFGDSMPVAPILYSWFYSLSANPILRLVPLCFFFLILATTSAICRKLFSENSKITRLALITLVSTLSLYWYMASSSLYLDLIFVFFITSSIYLLIHIIQEDSHKVTYLLFGINLALLAISKEFGVFYVWFILLIWLMQRYKKTRHDFLHSSVVTILMLTPFIIYNVGFQLIFSYYNAATVASTNIIRSFILIIFGLLLVLSLYGKDFQKQSFSRSSLLYTLLPFFIPLLFFGSTFFSLGSPFGSLLEHIYNVYRI